MKKLYSLIASVAVSLICGANAWAQDNDYDLDVQFESSTKDNYFKDWGNGITTSTTFGMTSNNKEYYVSLGSSANNAGQNYVEVLATSEIESVEFLCTSNGTKAIQPAILGWTGTEVTNTAEADFALLSEEKTIAKGKSNAEWITFDLSSEDLKLIRFYRQVKNISVNGATKANFGTNSNTVQLYGIRVKLKPTRTEVGRTTEITGVTINGEALSADDLATLNGEGHALTLDNTYIAAPAVVLTSTTTITYDSGDPVVKTAEVNATVVESEGNTFVATATVGEVEYTITVNKNLEPALEANPAAVTLESVKVMAGKATIHVTGANLTGDEVAIALPDVEGLTCDKTSLPITEGSVSDDIVLTYQSNDDVAESTVELTLAAGETEATVAVTYSSTAAVTEITPITSETIWDWANANSTEIKSDYSEVVLGNWGGWASDFNANALMGSAQYINRTNPHCFQGYSIKFKTTIDGGVKVKYSNTGSSNGTRTVCINGTPVGAGSKNTTAIEASLEGIEPGEVTISAIQSDSTEDVKPAAQIRIYYIKFGSPTSGIESVAADDENVAPVYYNLQGVRVAQPTNGAYIVVRGSKVSKEFIR